MTCRRSFVRLAFAFPFIAASVIARAQQASVYDVGAGASAPAAQAQATTAPPAANNLAQQQPLAAAPPAAAPPAGPPFQTTEADQQFVRQVLESWETESAKVNTFNAKFTRYEYDPVWGPGAAKENIRSIGTVSYSKPDKGSFKIDEVRRWTKPDPQNPAGEEYPVQKDEIGEHWVCDGKAVYEYNHRDKQLVVTTIPEEMRGSAIVDGPLPFLFGAEANKLQERYWFQPMPSPDAQVRLKAYPRRQVDAANYDAVEVMLDRQAMQPTALQVHLPGGQQRQVYVFQDATVNGKLDAWFGGLFSAPRTPLGWRRVAADEAAAAGPQAANPPDGVQR